MLIDKKFLQIDFYGVLSLSWFAVIFRNLDKQRSLYIELLVVWGI